MLKNKIGKLINYFSSDGSTYGDVKRAVNFLKSNEENYEKSSDYIKRKIFSLSRKLTEGDLKQARSANSLLNILLNNDGDAKRNLERR